MSKKEGSYSVFIISSVFILVSMVLVVLYKVVFPGEKAPLSLFSASWGLTRGFIDFILLFPALAFSGLVLPFGLQKSPGDQFSGFSSKFLEIIRGHILFAIIAAVIYGLLSLVALPLLMDSRSNMKYEGKLFVDSQDAAQKAIDGKDWNKAARYMAICENIWPNSPRTEFLRDRISLGLNEMEMAELAETRRESAADPWAELGIPPEYAPLDAARALAMAEKAFNEERYYDAHWLATLAGRLTREGSAEKKSIEIFAARAWNKIASLEPSSREMQEFSRFHRKQDGYNAMVSGDWIRAYYIFQDLMKETPNDQELQIFFAMTKEGVEKIAFFQDEMNTDIGELQIGAIFSLPALKTGAPPPGRIVIRMNTLSTFSDFSYTTGIEIIAFNSSGNLAYRMEAPYGKIIPLNIDIDDGAAGRSIRQSVLLMNVLDRNDKNSEWKPVWSGPERTNNTQIIMDVSYDDFLLLSNARRGLDGLSVQNLFQGISRLGSYGYIPEIFEAEILDRFAEPIVFLPMAILAIIIGWRFRAIKRTRYMIIPMIGILPVVFNGVVAFYRSVAHTIGVSLILNMSFMAAMTAFFAINFIFFILVLIILAGQHG